MGSNGNNRAGLLSAGGVLTIVAGILQIISVVSLIVYMTFPDWFMHIINRASLLSFAPFIAGSLVQYIYYGSDVGLISLLVAVVISILAIAAIVGGISSIRRSRFGLSLAGAICCLPSGLMGILAVIFVILGKREFQAKETDVEVI